MNEYVTEALILDREASAENDARIFLFSKDLGRITARARSAASIRSKLSGHLQPLMVSRVRLVEKNGVQVVDAVVQKNLAAGADARTRREFIGVARLIGGLTNEREPDRELWSLIESGELLGRRFLKVMGFDPEHAVCTRCEGAKPGAFLIQSAEYMCRTCLSSRSAGYVAVTSL